MYLKTRIEKEKCISCKLCILTCPDPNVIKVTEDKKIQIDQDRCKGCGLCVEICPKKALSIS